MAAIVTSNPTSKTPGATPTTTTPATSPNLGAGYKLPTNAVVNSYGQTVLNPKIGSALAPLASTVVPPAPKPPAPPPPKPPAPAPAVKAPPAAPAGGGSSSTAQSSGSSSGSGSGSTTAPVITLAPSSAKGGSTKNSDGSLTFTPTGNVPTDLAALAAAGADALTISYYMSIYGNSWNYGIGNQGMSKNIPQNPPREVDGHMLTTNTPGMSQAEANAVTILNKAGLTQQAVKNQAVYVFTDPTNPRAQISVSKAAYDASTPAQQLAIQIQVGNIPKGATIPKSAIVNGVWNGQYTVPGNNKVQSSGPTPISKYTDSNGNVNLAAALAGGVTADYLIQQGFTKQQVSQAQTYNSVMTQLKPYATSGGYNIQQALADGKITSSQLQSVGFSASVINQAEINNGVMSILNNPKNGIKTANGYDIAKALANKNVTASDLQAVGFSTQVISQAETTNAIMAILNNPKNGLSDGKGNYNIGLALSSKKVTQADLLTAGFTQQQINQALVPFKTIPTTGNSSKKATTKVASKTTPTVKSTAASTLTSQQIMAEINTALNAKNQSASGRISALNDAIDSSGLWDNSILGKRVIIGGNVMYADAKGNLLTQQDQVKIQWNNLNAAQQGQVASLYSLDLYRTNPFAETVKQIAGAGQKGGIIGEMAVAPFTGVAVPIAKKITGQKVTALETAEAVGTVLMDTLMVGGGFLEDLGPGGVTAVKATSSTAGGIFTAATVVNWPNMNLVEKVGSVVGDLMFFTPVAPSVKWESVVVPTDNGDITVWKGLDVNGNPLIGISGGHPAIGTTLGIELPELENIEASYKPITMVDTKVMATPDAMEKMGYDDDQIAKVQATLKDMNAFKNKSSPYLSSSNEPSTLKALTPDGVKTVLTDVIENKGDISEVYGSSTIKPQLAPELQGWREPADIDIQTKLDADGTAKFAQNLMKKLQATEGEDNVRIDPEKPTLIETKDATGWHHAVDIHATGEIGSSATVDPAAGYGYVGDKLVKPAISIHYDDIGDVDIMRLSESGLRKGIAILRWQPTDDYIAELQAKGVSEEQIQSLASSGPTTIAPEVQRLKDITDFYVIDRTLNGEAHADAWAEAYGYDPKELAILGNADPPQLEGWRFNPSASAENGAPSPNISALSTPSYLNAPSDSILGKDVVSDGLSNYSPELVTRSASLADMSSASLAKLSATISPAVAKGSLPTVKIVKGNSTASHAPSAKTQSPTVTSSKAASKTASAASVSSTATTKVTPTNAKSTNVMSVKSSSSKVNSISSQSPAPISPASPGYASPATASPPTGKVTNSPPISTVPPPSPKGKSGDVEFTAEDLANATTWKAGFGWWYRLPNGEYHFLRRPPAGAQPVKSGKGSGYASVQTIKGKPIVDTYRMGAVTVHINRPSKQPGARGAIAYHGNSGSGRPGLSMTRKGKMVNIRGVGLANAGRIPRGRILRKS